MVIKISKEKGEYTMRIEIPTYVRDVMDTLDRHGHRGYLVGGSLRDLLRGVTPHDYDLTTDATPYEMIEIFREYRVIPTGLVHGTLTVLADGHPLEITTHRVDGAYTDARHPESVSFTRALEGDLSRRDFTVNAMAWHPDIGLVDLFDGRTDLENGILRAVGDAETRFREDALRILRAFRFCAQLGFSIEADTLAGAVRAAEGLAKISVERIFAELCRLLESPHVDAGLAALMETGCGKYVFFDAVGGVNPISVASLAPEAALRMAAILPHLTKQEAVALGRRLHAPNAFGEALGAYLAASREPLPTDAYEARCFVSRYWHHWRGGLALQALYGADVEKVLTLCHKVSRDGSVVEIRRLAVNGRELQQTLGVRPAQTAELLRRLQDLVFRDPERNKRAALMEAAAHICHEEGTFCE